MNNQVKSNGFTALFLACILVTVAGCSDDETPVVVVPDPPVEPRSAAELVAGFQAAYEDRNTEAYLALLDPEFLFVLREETAARFPDLGATLDFDMEERIHLRMFSGSAVVDPGGELQPALQSVGFQGFRALDGWNTTDDPARFPDAVWAPFEVDFLFDCGQEYTTHKAAGMVKIYARAYTKQVNGKEVIYYKLAGMVDLTQTDKGVERTPLGLIKALYR